MKKALTLAAALLVGCSEKTAPQIAYPVKTPQVLSAGPEHSEFHEVLRDYIYCLYDQSLGLPSPDFNTARSSLEECLRASNFSSEDSRLLFEGRSVPDLEEYFASQGLVFRTFNPPGSDRSYELVRLSPVEVKELEIFGIKKTYQKVNVIEILIQNAYDHESELNLSNSGPVGGAHGFLPGAIELRPQTHEALAKGYFEGISSLKSELDKDLADHSRLANYSDAEFYDRLGKLFHYLAVRKEFSESKNFEDFKGKVVPRWTRESEIHEVMHLIDKQENKAMSASLDEFGKKKFLESSAVNLEARAYLAQLHHGNGYNNLGHMFASQAGDQPGSINEHQKAAKLILYVMNLEIKGNVESERSVYARMLNLSGKEINKLARKAFDVIYEGKSFDDYMKGVANHIIRNQRRHR